MKSAFLLISLVFSLPSQAQDNTGTDRMEIYADVFTALETGNKRAAADHLLAITNDDSYNEYHAEAFAQLASTLEELTLPYSALIAYQNALSIDASAIPSSISKAIALTDEMGDTSILEKIFTSQLGVEVDDSTRSRMAYLAAREAYRRGELGAALGIVEMVEATDPDFPEAQNIKGIILSQQDRPESALAPFQIAAAIGVDKDQKFKDAVLMNTARAYFAAENFPQAILHYAQVPRSSAYWLDAQFERAWAHFRIDDMNGVLGMMHTHNSPFFAEEYYPEGELLRIYSLMLMCKFAEANIQIDAFVEHFQPIQQKLAEIASKDGAELFELLRKEVGGEDSGLPDMVTRRFIQEDSFNDSLKSVQSAEDELERLGSVSGDAFAKEASHWMDQRIETIVALEGQRIQNQIQTMAEDVLTMINSTEISKLDILEMETQMLERAAMTGKMEDAKRQFKRRKRVKRQETVWEYEGEFWADEVGYYRVNTESECPSSMTTKE